MYNANDGTMGILFIKKDAYFLIISRNIRYG